MTNFLDVLGSASQQSGGAAGLYRTLLARDAMAEGRRQSLVLEDQRQQEIDLAKTAEARAKEYSDAMIANTQAEQKRLQGHTTAQIRQLDAGTRQINTQVDNLLSEKFRQGAGAFADTLGAQLARAKREGKDVLGFNTDPQVQATAQAAFNHLMGSRGGRQWLATRTNIDPETANPQLRILNKDAGEFVIAVNNKDGQPGVINKSGAKFTEAPDDAVVTVNPMEIMMAAQALARQDSTIAQFGDVESVRRGMMAADVQPVAEIFQGHVDNTAPPAPSVNDVALAQDSAARLGTRFGGTPDKNIDRAFGLARGEPITAYGQKEQVAENQIDRDVRKTQRLESETETGKTTVATQQQQIEESKARVAEIEANRAERQQDRRLENAATRQQIINENSQLLVHRANITDANGFFDQYFESIRGATPQETVQRLNLATMAVIRNKASKQLIARELGISEDPDRWTPADIGMIQEAVLHELKLDVDNSKLAILSPNDRKSIGKLSKESLQKAKEGQLANDGFRGFFE